MNNHKTTTLKVFGLIAIAFTLLSTISCGKKSTPEKTVETFFKALEQGDYDAAFSCTTAPEELRSSSVESYKQFNLKVVSYEILSTTYGADSLSAIVKAKNSQTTAFNSIPGESTEEYPLVLVDGQWKMDI